MVLLAYWKNICLIYNLIIMVGSFWTLWVLRDVWPMGRFLILIALFAFIANIYYCLGPLRGTCIDGDTSQDIVTGSKKAIVLRWEMLRTYYNMILLIEGTMMLLDHITTALIHFWMIIAIFVIVANVCYCFGPLLEICLATILKIRDRIRYPEGMVIFGSILFLFGLLFSMAWVFMLSSRGLSHIR